MTGGYLYAQYVTPSGARVRMTAPSARPSGAEPEGYYPEHESTTAAAKPRLAGPLPKPPALSLPGHAWAQRDPPAFADWGAKLAQAVAGWSHAVHVAMVRIDETPHALWDTVPAESHYQGCLTAFKPFDDLIRTFMQTSQCAITFDHTPQPTAPDLDLDVYKGADKAAKWIDKESSAVTGKAKSYVPVVVVGLGALVVVVVAVRKTVVG